MGKKKSGRRGWPEAPAPLPAPVVDNHAHLPLLGPDGAPLDDDDVALPPGEAPLTTAEQLARAAAVGVTRLITVGCDVPSLAGSVALAHAHRAVAAALAIHPNEAPLHAGVREIAPDGLDPAVRAHHRISLDDAVAHVAELARDPRVVAVGESGLDFFRTGEQGRAHQVRAFRDHIALAKDLSKPLQVHDRDAHAAVVETLLADGAPERTVFHCFSGDVELARTCAEHGWYASFAGPVTFKANEDLRAALRELPPELVLVETDAPYLTPAPYRGQPNASYVMPLTVAAIAEQLGLDLERACAVLTANTDAVYGTW
ncbi:TatD family deoxyribonuclease [Georgenia yuyongxinii]|uniref:TatD family deoxyribonuclease n=1 Tax=Georgenia yuyongxinii TaxID=2589797 RepID=A0A5B8C2X9_9MICO|nr:TatD family hydrolase [Georgenia yuyongxinii]QDC23891.1 TatD family deoxyribonuclease [Georgenia yuyongxinii]